MVRPPVLPIVCLLATSALADDETSFTTTPDSSWERIEPLKELGVGLGLGSGLDLANFDFSGQTCRITCGVPPQEIISAYSYGAVPRANLLAPTEFPDAVVSVDLISWQPPLPGMYDGSFPGVFTRIQPEAGFGKTDGFVFGVQPLQNNRGIIKIFRATNEYLDQLAASPAFNLDPSKTYRLVFASRGSIHTGRIFDLSRPGIPLASITAADNFFVSEPGRCGFGVAMPWPLPIDVTFDNFLAWDGTPAPLTIRQGETPGTIELLADTRRSMASDLETTTDPSDPAAWIPAVPAGITESGPALIRVFPMLGPSAFFRGKTP